MARSRYSKGMSCLVAALRGSTESLDSLTAYRGAYQGEGVRALGVWRRTR